MSVDPTRYFEIKGQVYVLKSASASPGVGNNSAIITAIALTRFRIMGLMAQSASVSTSGTLTLKNGSGGATLINAFDPPIVTNSNPLILPIIDCGYEETSTGVGLYADVITTGIRLTVFYIAYTP
jgi:hypothetical protein